MLGLGLAQGQVPVPVLEQVVQQAVAGAVGQGRAQVPAGLVGREEGARALHTHTSTAAATEGGVRQGVDDRADKCECVLVYGSG